MNIGSMVAGGVASLLSGGALGVFGAVGSGVLDYFKTKERNKQELAVISAQKDLILAQADSATLLETIKMMGASYENDKATYVGAGFVDTVRGLLRPAVTVYLVAITTGLAVWAFRRVGLEQAVVAEIAKFAVYTCLDLTGLCVAWYFGARQIDKVRRK